MNAHALVIDRARLRGALRPSQQRHRARIERLHRQVVAQGLEQALFREGIASHELVCIRHLAVRLRIALEGTDGGIVQQWVDATAQALAGALRAAPHGDVVRYPHVCAALVDMGRGIARGDLRRAWAWAQLGFGDHATLQTSLGAAGAFVSALVLRPASIVAVLGQLVRDGVSLEPIVAPRWVELATAALEVLQAGDAHSKKGASMEPADVSVTVQACRRALAHSPFLAEPHAEGSTRSAASARARALIALLDAQPMLARRWLAKHGATGLEQIVADAASAPPKLRPGWDEDPETQQPGGIEGGTPSQGLREPNDSDSATIDGAPRGAAPGEQVCSRPQSQHAGLMLLLAVFRRLSLWADVDAVAEHLDAPFDGVLWSLGRSLVGNSVDPNDPAVLAFIGRPPSSDPPMPLPEVSWGELEPLRTRIIAELEEVLVAHQDRPLRGEALLAWVIRRRAGFVGERGWIDVHFDLCDVDLDLRRAGLDLDPKWVPEIGAVVRFHYA